MSGERIGQYKILQNLGSGKTGVVYKGRDHQLKRDVAIKVIRLASQPKDILWERFEGVARDAAGLIHPNIVSVIDYGIEEGEPYLVMEYISGKSLNANLDIPMDWEQAVRKLIPVARALAYAHNEGVTHQRVNLANLIVADTGDLILTDFGMDRLAAYSEQSWSDVANQQDDVYHLASVLYEIVSGKDFISPSKLKSLDEVQILDLHLPKKVEQLFFKALHENPDRRFQSMDEFTKALEELMILIGIDELPYEEAGDEILENEKNKKRVKFVSKNWILLGALILFFVLMGVVCFGGVLWGVLGPPGINALVLSEPSIASSPTVEISTPTHTPLEPVTLAISETKDSEALIEHLTDTSLPPTLTLEPSPSSSPTPDPTLTTIPTPLGGGELIAFHSNRSGNNDIYIMNANSGELRQLTHDTSDDRAPSWSPDGGSIAYKSNIDGDYEIFILDLQTGHRRQVTRNDCNDHAPVWSPDARQFVFYSDCDGNREIFVIDADGDNRRQLTETSGGYNWFAVWSPDGRQIAFSSNRNGKYQIHLMNVDGTNVRALADGCLPFYSPDGLKIVFSQYCQDGGNIWVMNADGSNARPITKAPNDWNSNPSWSPDGQKIIFQIKQDEKSDIWVMDGDGSNWVQLTEHSAKDVAPVWQPSVILWDSHQE